MLTEKVKAGKQSELKPNWFCTGDRLRLLPTRFQCLMFVFT